MDTFFTTAGMGPVQILMMAVPIVVIVGLIAGTVVVNLRRWHKNNAAPPAGAEGPRGGKAHVGERPR